MAVTYELAPDGPHVRVPVNGPMTAAAIARMFEALTADPGFSPEMPLLFDLTHASSTETEGFGGIFAVFNMFTRTYEELGQTMRCVIYAPTSLQFGIARMFQNLCESSDTIVTAIFDDLDAARTCAHRAYCPLMPRPPVHSGDAPPPLIEGHRCDAPCGYVLPQRLAPVQPPKLGDAPL